MQNSASAVSIEGSAGKAQFGGGSRYSGDLGNYIAQVVNGLTGGQQQVQLSQPQQTTINGGCRSARLH